jgi:hypothetical protein
MTPRKTILRQLSEVPAGGFTRPSEISGFTSQPPGYRKALNGLLKDQLITGLQNEEGDLVVALSPNRLPQVHKELRPWFAAPAVWGGFLGGVLALAALGLIA